MQRTSSVLLLGLALLGSGAPLCAQAAKESQGAMLKNSGEVSPLEGSVKPRYSAGTGGSEVLAQNFVVAGKSCVRFDSSLDFMGADTVGIAILALNADIRQTRVIPFFGVDGAPYMVASGKVLQGSGFYSFNDSGSGIVPVIGNQMFVRVCNDFTDAIRYTQLTVYVSHR